MNCAPGAVGTAMQTIDSGACRTPGGAGQAGATQSYGRFHGSSQDRADQLVRTTVLSDLGQSIGHGRHARGIQGVADAVAKALSGQDVTGTDAADDVLKKIETSLHKAAQAMADRGVDGKTIDATIDRFRAQLAGALDGMVKDASGSGATGAAGSGNAGSSGTGSSGVSGSSGATGSSSATSGSATNAPTPATSVTSVSKFVAREVRKERGAIDLVTAEGDRVSIRFRSKEVVAGSVTQATSSDGTTTTAAKSSVFSRGGMKIEVDGDLNEDEQKAIGDLLGKVDDIATKFFSGDVQAAFSAAGSLGVDSDQIAGYRMNLTYSRKVASAYGAWGANPPASTQPTANGDGTTAAGSASSGGASSSVSSSGAAGAASGSTSGDSASGASGGVASGSGAPGGSASTARPSSSVDGSATASTDGSSSGAGTSSSGSASGAGTATGAVGSGAGATTGDSSSNTQPATSPPASAQKTIIDFINDALSKLSSANGAGRLSFSTHWKMSVLVTAIESTQPAQPTTAADHAAANNAQLLNSSLQKIASG